MGGIAGHMSHLYDNPSLTFSKMKEIMKNVYDANLEAEEKVDGQNLFLSYSIQDGKAKGARNKGNLRGGGLNATDLASKFADKICKTNYLMKNSPLFAVLYKNWKN